MSEKQLLIDEPTTALSTFFATDNDDADRQIRLNKILIKAWRDQDDTPLVQLFAEGYHGEVQIDLSIEDAKTIREWLDKAIFDAVKIKNKIEDEQRKAAKKEGGAK